MHLSGIFIYPVKALRGISLTSTEVDALGLVSDRRFMVVDADGKFLTQRTSPKMALIETALSDTSLTMSDPAGGACTVSLLPAPEVSETKVSIWGSVDLIAANCGSEVSEWLSTFLGIHCQLVRVSPNFHRPLARSSRPGDLVAFADAFPLLVLSEGSLNGLNDRLISQGEEPVPMDRFRPNFVVTGCPEFAEDTWLRINIGDLVLRAGGQCERCIVTTTNQRTAERGKEPLRTLARYRRSPADPSRINFGQNFIHETKSGSVAVGDLVAVIS